MNEMAPESDEVPMDQWQGVLVAYDGLLGDGKATLNPKPMPQSVNEEYSTYVMGALCTDSTSDALRFWRVSFYMKFTRID